MSVLVGRHGLSEANDRNNVGTPLFGHPDAALMDEGRMQARRMGFEFRTAHSVDPARTIAAVSQMKRAQETAWNAGFAKSVRYDSLNEVSTGLEYLDLKQMIADRNPSEAVIQAATLILEAPPVEQVWITHGLVIAGLCEVLGVADQFERFVPKFCEIRELPI